MNAARAWVLVVPDPGVGFLSANGRQHWRAKATATRAWRQAGALHARALRLPALTRAHILVTVHHADARRRDAANLAPTVKALVDGLVDAGVLPDDDDKHLLGPDLRTGPPVPRGFARRLVVCLTELDTDTPDPLTTLSERP